MNNSRNWNVDWGDKGRLIMEIFENGVLPESRIYTYQISSWALRRAVFAVLNWRRWWPDGSHRAGLGRRDFEGTCLSTRPSVDQTSNSTAVTSPLLLPVDAHFSGPCLSTYSLCRVDTISTFRRSCHAEQSGPHARYIRTRTSTAKFFCRQYPSTCRG